MPSEREASKLKLSNSCTQNTGVLKFELGLDLVCIALKEDLLLRKKRHLQVKFKKSLTLKKRKGGFEFNTKFLSSTDKRDLRKIAKHTGLVKLHPNSKEPKWFDFSNEERVLEDYFNERGELFKKRGPFSKLETYSFIGSLECGYKLKIGSPVTPNSVEEWKSFSWGLIASRLVYGISQKRIGEFLNRSEMYVNQILGKNRSPFLIKENRFLKVTKSMQAYKMLKKQYDANQLTGFYPDATGALVKQLPNYYKLDRKVINDSIRFTRKVFKYQNKILNEIISKNNNLQNEESLVKSSGSYAYKAKLNALKQCKKRLDHIVSRSSNKSLTGKNNLLNMSGRKCSRKKEASFYSIKEVIGHWYGTVNQVSFRTTGEEVLNKKGRRVKEYESTYNSFEAINNLPDKWSHQFSILKSLGLELTDQFYSEKEEFFEDIKLHGSTRLISDSSYSSYLEKSINRIKGKLNRLLDMKIKSVEQMKEQKRLSMFVKSYYEYQKIEQVLNDSKINQTTKEATLAKNFIYNSNFNKGETKQSILPLLYAT